MPQTLALLEAGGITPAKVSAMASLTKAGYAPCHSVMAMLDGASGLPEPGAVMPEEGPIKIICDNKMKGITDLNAITLQPHHDYSAAHFEEDRKEVGRNLLEAARPFLKAEVSDFHVQRWKFSSPVTLVEGTHFHDSSLPGLVLAGDMFLGARVESAYMSGTAAAQSILDYLRGDA
jgi:predicted NAD/FAD-dependent oxidoreductase